MIVTHLIGNLVKENLDAFIHQANCFNTMGSGVAKDVRGTYPEVYEADLQTEKGARSKLGTFSFAKTKDGKVGYNLYSQFDYGYDGKLYTNYEAMRQGLEKIREHIKQNLPEFARIGIPCKMGCARGGGDWNEVLKIIKEVFEETGLNIVICEFREYSTKSDDLRKQAREAYKKAELLGTSEGEEAW